jgi:hypothetical protein
MSREHAIIEKKVINLDHAGDRHVMCAWDDCQDDGYDLNQVRLNYGTGDNPYIVKHVFCTERHKQYWINSVRHYGHLPPGFRRSVLLCFSA